MSIAKKIIRKVVSKILPVLMGPFILNFKGQNQATPFGFNESANRCEKNPKVYTNKKFLNEK